MIGAMAARHGGGNWPPFTALMAVARDRREALAAIDAGADIVDLGVGGAGLDGLRAAAPDVLICADRGPADIVREPAAAPYSARLICADVAAAVAAGRSADRALVRAVPLQIARLTGNGWASLVEADDLAARAGAPGATGAQAIAALACWLGASCVRTRHVAQVRRALDMAASIRGLRPPARAVRGLA